MATVNQLKDIANILRRDSIEMTTSAGSGHPSSCLSAAEIMATLFFNEMSYDTKNPFNPNNDEFVLSKGHAAPILYSSLYRAGCIKDNLNSLRKLSSRLEGHPLPRSLSWVKVATGSLGQGLSVGVGMALAAKLQKRDFKTYVLLGDSEVAEGSIYEAFDLASYYKLDNLCSIVDVNRLGQTGQTIFGHNLKAYKKIFSSFGWNVIIVNGHDIKSLLNAFNKFKKTKNKPTVILAKTLKGKGVDFIEDKENWHGKTLSNDELVEAFKQIPFSRMPKIKIKKPKAGKFISSKIKIPKISPYELHSQVATRDAYGNALVNLVKANPNVIVTDAEVSNSTKSELVKKIAPKRFIETFIAEQNMIGIALGLSVKGFDVFASTFAAFLTRAHDQLRMSALSSANFTVCGSHCGVSIGEDGPSQMGLEDIAMFRDLPNSTVFYPSDAVSAEKLVYESLKVKKGITYIRTTRPKTPVIYSSNEKFPVGDFKVPKKSDKDKIVLVGAGITLHESIKAHEILKAKGINSAVVDLYCIKPFNVKKFISFIKRHGNKIVVSEDHYSEGGIGEMLASSITQEKQKVPIKFLNIKEIPHSGKKEQLLEKYKIDSGSIVNAAKNLITNK